MQLFVCFSVFLYFVFRISYFADNAKKSCLGCWDFRCKKSFA